MHSVVGLYIVLLGRQKELDHGLWQQISNIRPTHALATQNTLIHTVLKK